MLAALRVATSSLTLLRISAAAAFCADVLRRVRADDLGPVGGKKLRADHGGSSPSGVLPRAKRAQSL